MEHPWTKVEELKLVRPFISNLHLIGSFVYKVFISKLIHIIIDCGEDRLSNPEKHVQNQIPIIVANMYEVHATISLLADPSTFPL